MFAAGAVVFVGCVFFAAVVGRLLLAPGFVMAWGAYLMVRAAKAGKYLGDIERADCTECAHRIASVLAGRFCSQCSKPVHNDCLGAHLQKH